MDFIEEALNSITGEEFVQSLADIYLHPEVCLSELPTWIRNLIIVMDYDTEIQMDGLSNKSYKDVIDALNVMGLNNEASVLSKLTGNASDEAIEECYLGLAINNDYDVFWEKVFQYADWNLRI